VRSVNAIGLCCLNVLDVLQFRFSPVPGQSCMLCCAGHSQYNVASTTTCFKCCCVPGNACFAAAAAAVAAVAAAGGGHRRHTCCSSSSTGSRTQLLARVVNTVLTHCLGCHTSAFGALSARSSSRRGLSSRESRAAGEPSVQDFSHHVFIYRCFSWPWKAMIAESFCVDSRKSGWCSAADAIADAHT